MSPLFLFTILIPKIIIHDISFTFIRVKQVKYSLFMGAEQQRYPFQQGSQKSADFWEEEERRQPQRAKRVLCCKAVLTSQRLCLTYSTHWVLRMI